MWKVPLGVSVNWHAGTSPYVLVGFVIRSVLCSLSFAPSMIAQMKASYLRCGGLKKQSLQSLTGGRCPPPSVESGQLLWAETCIPESPVDSAQCVSSAERERMNIYRICETGTRGWCRG